MGGVCGPGQIRRPLGTESFQRLFASLGTFTNRLRGCVRSWMPPTLRSKRYCRPTKIGGNFAVKLKPNWPAGCEPFWPTRWPPRCAAMLPTLAICGANAHWKTGWPNPRHVWKTGWQQSNPRQASASCVSKSWCAWLALNRLSSDQRQVIELHHLKGWPIAQVAETMQRSKPSVMGLLFRGQKKLREFLEEAGDP